MSEDQRPHGKQIKKTCETCGTVFVVDENELPLYCTPPTTCLTCTMNANNRAAIHNMFKNAERDRFDHPLNTPPKLTMLACGVITPTEVSTSRVTPTGWAVHTRDTVPVEHHAYTPVRRTTGWQFWLAALVFALFIGTMLVDIVATCAGRVGT